VPPGSMATVSCIDQIRATFNQKFFVVWTAGPTLSKERPA
jgi:hypothetical protein